MNIIQKIQENLSVKRFIKLGIFLSTFLFMGLAFADNGKPHPTPITTDAGIGVVAKNITGSFQNIAQLFLAIAWLGGMGFSVASIFKFKQHKDNPTQVPLGTPIALLSIAVALIFLGYFIKPLGETFGAKSENAGGPRGETSVPGLGTYNAGIGDR